MSDGRTSTQSVIQSVLDVWMSARDLPEGAQGSAKRWDPGCVNVRLKIRVLLIEDQETKLLHHLETHNLGSALKPTPSTRLSPNLVPCFLSAGCRKTMLIPVMVAVAMRTAVAPLSYPPPPTKSPLAVSSSVSHPARNYSLPDA